jgi:hypothetical protein
MAVNVDIVYRTVLLILNKEQRGYLTPDEFNRTATQVQLEIFNEYFEDLNQQYRVNGNDTEYSDRVKNLEEKISIFQTEANCVWTSGYFYIDIPLPSGPLFLPRPEVYKLGTVIYKGEKEVQYVQPNELLELNLSPLTRPTVQWPVYKYSGNATNGGFIYVYPTSIQTGITCTFIRKPQNPIWNFTASPPNYQYVYNSTQFNALTNPNGSQDFELHPTEQTNLITKILLYSGVVIKDPQIVQIAAQQVQAENINSKS